MIESEKPSRVWRYVRGLLPPVLLWTLFVAALVDTLQSRLHGDDAHDEAALREWIEEARVFRATLPDVIREYLNAAQPGQPNVELPSIREKIQVQIKSLADPTKVYGGQLPLFPAIYRLELEFPENHDPALPPIVWESGIPRPRQSSQRRVLDHWLLGREAR